MGCVMKRSRVTACAAALALSVSGCASSRSGRVYSRDSARREHAVELGTVQLVSEVTIEGTKTAIGPGVGGVAGGVLGSTVGKGRGTKVGAVVGAAVGAAAGAVAEEGITRRKGLEITVKLDNGRTISIVQEADDVFTAGARVRVLKGPDGTVRVRQ